MKPSFKTIALVGKYKSPEVAAPLLKLARFLERRKVEVLMDRVAGSRAGRGRYPALPLEDLARKADLAIVIGGDGTMLNIARTLAPRDVALIGVSQGRLGFLTDISVENMLGTIGAILDGKFLAEKRMLLEGRVDGRAHKASRALAFNDVVVSKGARGNLIELEVRIDGEFMYHQRSDGLIVATPTGSTAYSLSAGGPIVHPGVEALLITPICPHTFNARSVIINPSDDVTVEVAERTGDVVLTVDGRIGTTFAHPSYVTIRKAAQTTVFIRLRRDSFYNMLRTKLSWGQR